MAIVCTVRIPLPLGKVEEIEKANPDVLNAIIAAARKHMLSHRRFASDRAVLDLDEYASREDYDEFMNQAGNAIRRFGEVLGVTPLVEVWQATEP